MYRSRPYPNGCCSVASRRDRLPPSSSSPWLPESATEWIDSASIDEEPVSANAANLVTAMPMFAPSAATIALVPPAVLTATPRRKMRRCSSRQLRGGNYVVAAHGNSAAGITSLQLIGG